MEKKINIAELLKDCPKGMELDSPVWNNIVFEEIDGDNIVIFRKSVDAKVYLTQYGEVNSIDGKCVIYPKGETTWEGFVPPCKFKDGDIIFTDTGSYTWVSIFKQFSKNICYTYIDLCITDNQLITDTQGLCNIRDINTQRLATNEEKQKLFYAIKANGYKWNAETKTLEKLVEPKFKVGDIVRLKSKPNYIYTIHCLTWDDNKKLAYKLLPKNDKHLILVSLNKQDNYELVPNKFDITTLIPFESRVLVRDDNKQKWKANFWGFYNNSLPMNFPFSCCGTEYAQCIPYNDDTKHLLGTTDDCDEFYRTWE